MNIPKSSMSAWENFCFENWVKTLIVKTVKKNVTIAALIYRTRELYQKWTTIQKFKKLSQSYKAQDANSQKNSWQRT